MNKIHDAEVIALEQEIYTSTKELSYIHQAEAETGHHCKVYMDLAGPKVRIASVLLRYGEAKVLFDGYLYRLGLVSEIISERNISIGV